MQEQLPTDDIQVSTESEDAPNPPEAGAAPDGEAVATRASRPLEVVKGIHPELLCVCPECEPDHVELQWFSPEEVRKQKGDAMLYCQRSSRKYFTPIIDLNRWLASRAPVSRRRSKD